MNFLDYHKRAEITAIYRGTIPHPDDRLAYTLLGLASEAGEAAGVLAKALRAGETLNKDKLASELGDVLWFLAMATQEMGLDLETIADRNLTKLRGRAERGTLVERGTVDE